MSNSNIYVKNYHSVLNVINTERAVQLIKNKFSKELAKTLSLHKISAPLFLESSTNLNDQLSGKTKAVSFLTQNEDKLEIVQSLAKWKRHALMQNNLSGIYTDMIAIRPKEELDNIHSILVDQWDWEKVIKKKERNVQYLKNTVRKIYQCFKDTAKYVTSIYPKLTFNLPEEITFITSEELLKRYPHLSPSMREYKICKKYTSVFIMNIGNKLSNGTSHDDRAADYDDWNLNGDIIIWNKVLNIPMEISSMGIRVDKTALLHQLKEKNELDKIKLPYYQGIIKQKMPFTIGGGIGQSRLCMFMLQKAHIGEIQASYWSKQDINKFKKININLL